jgi:hypothetical protein
LGGVFRGSIVHKVLPQAQILPDLGAGRTEDRCQRHRGLNDQPAAEADLRVPLHA